MINGSGALPVFHQVCYQDNQCHEYQKTEEDQKASYPDLAVVEYSPVRGRYCLWFQPELRQIELGVMLQIIPELGYCLVTFLIIAPYCLENHGFNARGN